MSFGLQLNSSAGVIDSIDASTTFLDADGIVVMNNIQPSGTRTLTGFNGNRHSLYVIVTGGFLPIWWITGTNVFNWSSYNGNVTGMRLLIMRKT